MVIVTQRWGRVFQVKGRKGSSRQRYCLCSQGGAGSRAKGEWKRCCRWVGRGKVREVLRSVFISVLCNKLPQLYQLKATPTYCIRVPADQRHQNPNLSVNSEKIHHLVIGTFNQTHKIIVQKWNENYQNTLEDSACSSPSMKVCRKSNWDQNAQLLIHDEKISWNKKILESACPSHSLSESRNTQEAQHTFTRMSYKCQNEGNPSNGMFNSSIRLRHPSATTLQ